jgi:uncharacterized protein (DUF58 family)
MNYKTLRQLFSLRDLRNAFLGLSVVFGGIGLALLTYYASVTENPRLAGVAAALSLVFIILIVVFVIPPLARSASAEASQLNLPFEFTVGGAIYLGLMIIVGFSAWNTGNNLLFLVLAFLLSALIVSFVVGNFVLKKIDVKMRFPETIYAGEPTPILVSLHNRKLIFPTFSIIVDVRGTEREKSVTAEELERILPKRIAEKFSRPPVVRRTLDYFIHIPRRQAIENKVEHVFEHRGRFIIKDFELSTRFPFAFFRHRRRLSAQEVSIVIFPKTLPIEQELEDLPLEAGKLVSERRGLGQDLLSLRDYQPNDDLRRVDWKATARARRLIVREFAAEDEKRVTIVFDTRLRQTEKEKEKTLRERIEEEQKGNSAPLSSRFEQGVSLIASLLTHFTEEKVEVRLILSDDETVEFGIGVAHLNENLRRLATIEPQFVEMRENISLSQKLAEILEERNNSHIFLITTLKETDLPEEIEQRLKIIRY